MEFLEKLQSRHFDVLKEVGNIGAGHAATALSALLNRKIEMTVPSVRLVPIQTLPEQIGGAGLEVAAIFLRLTGEATGSMYFITSIQDSEQLVQQLTDNRDFQLHKPPFEQMGLSALQELGNILAGSYLSSFSDFTGLNLQPTVPELSIDMAGAILSYGLIPLSEAGNFAIVIETEISGWSPRAEQVLGYFLLLPDPGSFQTIFAALGVDMDG